MPVLSLSEIHIWLSNPMGTRRYVRGLDEITAEDYAERRQYFLEHFNVSIDDLRA